MCEHKARDATLKTGRVVERGVEGNMLKEWVKQNLWIPQVFISLCGRILASYLVDSMMFRPKYIDI